MEQVFDILESVKSAFGITGTYQDLTLKFYIEEVKQFLLDAGVLKSVVDSPVSYGVISRGVFDLWNYGAGNGELSSYFMMRATQLYYKKSEDLENGGV